VILSISPEKPGPDDKPIDGIRQPSATREPSQHRPVSPAAAFAAAVVLAGFVATFVYGRAAGYVYSEDSDYAIEFGHHSWYHALSFSQILGQYFSLGHGWYRPTGFYLIPYVLRIDYFQPSEQITLDIATLLIAAVMVILFVRRPRVLTAMIASLAVLLAPALYQVTYGVQADSFYIIFGLAFLWLADRLYYGHDGGWRRAGLRAGLALVFFLTVTTKEVGCIVAVLMVPFLLLRGPDLSKERVLRVVRFASPFLFAVVGYGIIYKSLVNATGPTYSSHLNLDRSLNFINLVSWTLGFRSPRHTFENWVPNWSHGEAVVQALLLAAVLGGLLLTWRRFRPWRIGLFLLTALGTSVAIASVGGIPYHGYPLVIMYGFAILLVLEAVADRFAEIKSAQRRSFLLRGGGVVAVVLIGLIVYEGHSTYGGVIAAGPQTPYLEASTQLFYGSTLAPVRHANDPLLVFNDCLSGLHNPLKFYAQSATGTELIVRGAFSYPAVQPAMQVAYKSGRPVFAALCTGVTDPWYVLRQYEGPKRGLIPAGI
jgi:hypothetical protein